MSMCTDNHHHRLKRQSHKIFVSGFFLLISSSWSHWRCPRAVLIFSDFSQSYWGFKTTLISEQTGYKKSRETVPLSFDILLLCCRRCIESGVLLLDLPEVHAHHSYTKNLILQSLKMTKFGQFKTESAHRQYHSQIESIGNISFCKWNPLAKSIGNICFCQWNPLVESICRIFFPWPINPLAEFIHTIYLVTIQGLSRF